MDTSTQGTQWGTGGMATKLTAARIATAAGCRMVICTAAEPANIVKIIGGERIGTVFHPTTQPIKCASAAEPPAALCVAEGSCWCLPRPSAAGAPCSSTTRGPAPTAIPANLALNHLPPSGPQGAEAMDPERAGARRGVAG